jgi:hypothetical protein
VSLDAPGLGESPAVYPEATDWRWKPGVSPPTFHSDEAEIRSAAVSTGGPLVAIDATGTGNGTRADLPRRRQAPWKPSQRILVYPWAFLSWASTKASSLQLHPGSERRNSHFPDAGQNWNHRQRKSAGGPLQSSDPSGCDGIPVYAKMAD